MASNGNGRRVSVVSRRRARPDPRGKNYKWIALSRPSSATTRSSICWADRSGRLPAHTQAVITGRSFFPQLIASPFRDGLHEAFAFAIVACLVAAVASWSRGKRYVDAGTHVPLPAVDQAPAAVEA